LQTRGGTLGEAPPLVISRIGSIKNQTPLGSILTKQSTAAILVSPKTLGTWGDKGWRLSEVYELIEGGSTSYLLRNSNRDSDPGSSTSSLMIAYPNAETLLETFIAMLSINLGTSRCLDLLEESHNLTSDGSDLAPFWDLADDVLDCLCRELASIIRIGIVALDDMSMADREFTKILREKDFEVTLFAPGT